MSTRILTLFGEEIVVPEPQKPPARTRAKKGEDDSSGNEETEDAQAEQPTSELVSSQVVPDLFGSLPAAPTEAINETDTVIETHEAPVAANGDELAVEEVETETAIADDTEEAATDDIETTSVADIIPEDWAGDKQYYTIGEVAGFFKVKTSHIRFWTTEFKLKVRTTRKGDRLYTAAQVKELRAIYHLVKGRGFTLSGAKAKLKTQNKRDVTTIDLRTSLLHLREKLVILRDQLATTP